MVERFFLPLSSSFAGKEGARSLIRSAIFGLMEKTLGTSLEYRPLRVNPKIIANKMTALPSNGAACYDIKMVPIRVTFYNNTVSSVISF